jgi:hypothetical protein
MKTLRTALVASLLIAAAFSSPAPGQQPPVPSFKLDNAGRDVVELSGLFSDPLCHTGRVRGRVADRVFDQETGTVLTGFTVEESTGERTHIKVEFNPANADRVTAAWVTQGLQNLLTEGNSVVVGAFFCGAAERVAKADTIRLLSRR